MERRTLHLIARRRVRRCSGSAISNRAEPRRGRGRSPRRRTAWCC